MREPPFWWREAGIEAHMLAPAAAIYGAVATRRLRRSGRRAGAPVVCIGNPTVGGAGKTPTVMAVARMLAAAGERPVLLSRGYGGRLHGPLQVDPLRHCAADVGDEPLLLARVAPTVVAHDRVAGAAAAVAAEAGVIVMDDGFQNPSLAKDFSVLVVDGRRGIGNARVIPAGPLRAPLDAQLDRAHAILVVGPIAGAAAIVANAQARRLPVFRARLEPDAGFIAALGRRRVLAFAGIGTPEKVFATLSNAGAVVAATRSFADHHRYTPAEIRSLCKQADDGGLVLVTTEKDQARLQGEATMAEFAARVLALPVTLALEEEAEFRALLLTRIAAARAASRATA
jgi:tetraacyldisaccharide 4'-kinase